MPLPDGIGPEEGLLRVDACGICGSDYEQYNGLMPGLPFPLIPGHEPVGTIVELGDIAARRWGVARGDRVCVETLLPCGYCRACRSGQYRLCSGRRGLSVRGISDLERGVRRAPHPATIARLADALDLDSSARESLLAAATAAPPLKDAVGQTIAARGTESMVEERRWVTVLCVQLGGFAGLADQLDPEDLHALAMQCSERTPTCW